MPPFRRPEDHLWGFHVHCEANDFQQLAACLHFQKNLVAFLQTFNAPILEVESFRKGYGPHQSGHNIEIRLELPVVVPVDENRRETNARRLIPLIGLAAAFSWTNSRACHSLFTPYLHLNDHDESKDASTQLAQEHLAHTNAWFFEGKTPLNLDFFMNPPRTEDGACIVDTRNPNKLSRDEHEALLRQYPSESIAPTLNSIGQLVGAGGFRILGHFSGRSPAQRLFAVKLYCTLLEYLLVSPSALPDSVFIERDPTFADSSWSVLFSANASSSSTTSTDSGAAAAAAASSAAPDGGEEDAPGGPGEEESCASSSSQTTPPDETEGDAERWIAYASHLEQQVAVQNKKQQQHTNSDDAKRNAIVALGTAMAFIMLNRGEMNVSVIKEKFYDTSGKNEDFFGERFVQGESDPSFSFVGSGPLSTGRKLRWKPSVKSALQR